MKKREPPVLRVRASGALAALGVCACLISSPSDALAEAASDPDRPSQNLFGMTGLIDTPTAEMQPDGQVSISSSYFGGFLRNTLTAQIFPGVEAAFRYSVLGDFFEPGADETSLFDRSFDVKLRIVEEAAQWPGVVLGFQDFLGTGEYSGEYIAATKNFLGGDLKVTAGVGWGRFAGINGVDNPLKGISDEFATRGGTDEFGGTVNFGQFFRGDQVGLFGGIEWQTPVEGLSLKLEYNGDDYDRERVNSDFDPKVPINFGVEYRPADWIDIGAYYMYGSEFGVRVTLSANPLEPTAPQDTEPAPLPFPARTPPPDAPAAATALLGDVIESYEPIGPSISFREAPITDVSVEERIAGIRWAVATLPPSAGYECPAEAAKAIDAEYGVLDAVSFHHPDGKVVCTIALRPEGQFAIRDTQRSIIQHPTAWHASEETRQQIIEALTEVLAADKIDLYGIELLPERVTVYVENGKYRSMPRAIGRTARALARQMPPSVELFEIVPVESSMPMVAVAIQRSNLEDHVNRPDAARLAWLAADVRDAPPIDIDRVERVSGHFPRTYWALEPAIPISIFDPDQPVRFDLAAIASAGIEILPGLSFNAAIQKRIVGQLDDITRESDSELPRVRSDFAEYLREGDPGIIRLTGDYVTKLDDDIYGRVSVGYLEQMFGGISGEILWKPANQSWGVGAELNYTKQREFDTLFAFRSYDVVTGHVSVYWDTPFHGIAAQIDAGRYLAGDYGATLTLKRRFANGWEIGGFATLTDVPFDEFGEGSFDKGIFLTIPLNWALPYETRSELRSVIRPLTRDGGQRLNISNRLYPIVEDQHRGGLRTNWGNFWR